MCKFGIVYSRFFLWARRQGLSDKAKVVGAHMLVCEHGNSLGCYRLPPSYVAADLGYLVDEVEKVYGELSTAGLLVYCEESEMVFFPQYLKWNPPNNGKHAKAILKIAESLPSAFGFGDMLVESLEKYCGEFIDKDALDTVSIPYRYGIDTPENKREKERKRIKKIKKEKEKTLAHVPVRVHPRAQILAQKRS